MKIDEKNLNKSLIIDALIVNGIIFVLLSVLFIFNIIYIPLGFLLGAVISIINQLVISVQVDFMINPKYRSFSGLVPLFFTTRFALYGGGLFLAFYLNYIGYNIFAWYMVFAGYMIIKIITIVKYRKYIPKKGDHKEV